MGSSARSAYNRRVPDDSFGSRRPPQRYSWRPSAACEAFRLLHRGEFYVLYLDRDCALLLAQRTPARFERIPDIERCFTDLASRLAHLERARLKLLVDVRKGPSRNDEAFEAANEKHRGKLLFGFERNAALVASLAGRL